MVSRHNRCGSKIEKGCYNMTECSMGATRSGSISVMQTTQTANPAVDHTLSMLAQLFRLIQRQHQCSNSLRHGFNGQKKCCGQS